MSGRCDCGCRGTSAATPTEVTNPPGQGAIHYRVGTYREFRSSMLARLSGPAYPALRDLTVRTPDDPAIGLLDTWAVLGDLLTFYSERIANEGYLRTATEDGSLTLLGRLVGHRPRPGVAADTFLAYTLDRDPRPGQETPVLIPRGARSQSVPGPGEEPQSFETSEELTARWSWNELAVLRRRPYQVTPDRLEKRTELFVAGTANNVKPGDQLLFVFSAEESARDKRFLRTVPHVRIDRENDVTVIGLPIAAQPSLKRLREELGRWIAPSAKDSPHPRPRGSRLVERFDKDVLAPLRGDLDALKTATALAERLIRDVERVHEAAELARRYQDIAGWFETLAAKFIELTGQARALEPPQPPKPPAGDGKSEPLFAGLRLGSDAVAEHGGQRTVATEPNETGEPANPANPAFRGLGALLPALRTAPVRPPAGARHLARDPERIYAPGSDIGAQLLAVLDTRVRDQLHDAWRQADLTAPLALATVQVMRATATPFGATAPMKPRYKNNNEIDHYEDWPLSGSTSLDTTVTYDTAGTVPAKITFTHSVADSSSPTKELTLPDDEEINKKVPDVGPGEVQVSTLLPPPEPDPDPAGEPGGAAPPPPRTRTRSASARNCCPSCPRPPCSSPGPTATTGCWSPSPTAPPPSNTAWGPTSPPRSGRSAGSPSTWPAGRPPANPPPSA
ncbi:hypothetical protein ACQEVX_01070 [Streptomyces syringium]|uniref:hypothetical protein n=1 Tax=Streptomyces syringium TaxID=76729 RepID=UPI003D8B32D3